MMDAYRQTSDATFLTDLEKMHGRTQDFKAVGLAQELLALALKRIELDARHSTLVPPDGKLFAITAFKELVIGRYLEDIGVVSPYEDLPRNQIFHAGMLVVSGEHAIGVSPDRQTGCTIPEHSLLFTKLVDAPPAA